MARIVADITGGLGRVGAAIGLTAALVGGSPSQAGAVAGYEDVPEGTWYTNAVQWSVDNGITDIEDFCFGPETPVSRGETAVWIYNMEDQPAAGEPHSFTDVTNTSQDDAISWMADTGITTGTSPTTFAPDETLKRAQAAAFLHRLAGEPSAPQHHFSDVVADWQQGPVSWMVNTGITTGTSPTTFAPDDTLKRAQLITFLYRYMGEPEVTLNAPTALLSGVTPTCNQAEEDAEAEGALGIPPIPQGLAGTKVDVSWGPDDARIWWDPVPGATHYRVFQSGDLDATVSAPDTSYYDNIPNENSFLGFKSFRTTVYSVAACNEAGCSARSASVTIS